jgi:hypothetical protein
MGLSRNALPGRGVLRAVIVALAYPGLGGCDGPEIPRVATSPPPEIDEPEWDDPDVPVRCKTDADCPPLGCGPCVPGAVVTQEHVSILCHHNPCTDSRAVCSPQHVCVAGPDTRKDPYAWCPKCAALERDIAAVCGGDADAKASEACEKALAEAIESCNDGTCTAARNEQIAKRGPTTPDDPLDDEPIGDEPPAYDSLPAAAVTRGFQRALGKARDCPGLIPGMKIKVSATITGEGKVLAAHAQGSSAALPASKCVAKAVKEHARFARTKRTLDSLRYTFSF